MDLTAGSSAKDHPRPRVVGVIMSPTDLDFAMRMRSPPDLFELRLDHLVRIAGELENKLLRLRVPLIITARHSQEGGANKLTLRERRDLLSRFLCKARYIDVELRSASALHQVRVPCAAKHARRKRMAQIFSKLRRAPTPRCNSRDCSTSPHRKMSILP